MIAVGCLGICGGGLVVSILVHHNKAKRYMLPDGV
jgi:hypothetical protein